MKVKIKDYQVIKEAELEFKPGLTVIVGESNNGKSSIIRAIEAAINNKGGSSFINHDKDFCEVTIEDGDAKIVWKKHRKSAKSQYSINGNILNKIGQKQIGEVAETLGMPEILINTDKFRLNFWKQLDYPFLVGRTAGQLFDFISNSKDQELMFGIQEEVTANVKSNKQLASDINAKIDLTSSNIAKANEEIKLLEGVNEFDIEALEKLISIKEDLSKDIQIIIESTEDKKELEEILKRTEADMGQSEHYLSKVQDNIKKAIELADELDVIMSLEESLVDNNKLLVDYTKEIDVMFKNLGSIKVLTEEYDTLITQQKELSELLDISTSAHTELKNKKKDYEDLLEVIEEVNKELKEFKVCPLCGNSLENHNHEGEKNDGK